MDRTARVRQRQRHCDLQLSHQLCQHPPRRVGHERNEYKRLCVWRKSGSLSRAVVFLCFLFFKWSFYFVLFVRVRFLAFLTAFFQMYTSDCYGNAVQEGNCPFPTTLEGSNAVFNAVGDLFSDAFDFAHELGVKTCVGTETPLSPPPTLDSVVEPLNVYRSPSRHDSFVTTTLCDECNDLYQFVSLDGFVWSGAFEGSVALNTYYNGHDNMLSTSPNPPAGYQFVRTEGYAWPNTTDNSSLVPMSLYYNEEFGDHFSTWFAEHI